ncbi:hypothetical protein [Methylobacterium planeticum]|uniref:Uncharacterized protein n=1 Tax=Methylobacterium planeticum TaxID=2615211 RepID=A0A6N6MUW8_9HYPH|nr:hypothetical protein [Methylobacterium planeticum]KAB1072647.1 hypothetical protein F6X51_15290 [Methylobacterium planeticum]
MMPNRRSDFEGPPNRVASRTLMRAELISLRARVAVMEKIVIALLDSTLDWDPVLSTLRGGLSDFEETFDDQIPIIGEQQDERAALRDATRQHLARLMQSLDP